MDRFLTLPLAEAVGLLFVVVMLRANATYWLGRGLVAGAAHTRLQRHLEGLSMRRAERLVSRYGVLAVPLSFLTIGLQTAVNAGAGAARMPLRRYLPAVALGGLAWAVLYATIGMAALYAGLAVASRSPWGLAVLVVVLAAVATVALVRHRRRGAAVDCPVAGLPEQAAAQLSAPRPTDAR